MGDKSITGSCEDEVTITTCLALYVLLSSPPSLMGFLVCFPLRVGRAAASGVRGWGGIGVTDPSGKRARGEPMS